MKLPSWKPAQEEETAISKQKAQTVTSLWCQDLRRLHRVCQQVLSSKLLTKLELHG